VKDKMQKEDSRKDKTCPDMDLIPGFSGEDDLHVIAQISSALIAGGDIKKI
jgi:hypothetical protein